MTHKQAGIVIVMTLVMMAPLAIEAQQTLGLTIPQPLLQRADQVIR